MKIKLKRLNDAVKMEALNDEGNSVVIDGAPSVGGTQAGMRPMQLLLAGLGGCSGIDVVDVLKKQRQNLEDIRIEINGEREDQPAPSVFTNIHVHYTLKGALDPEKVKRAIDLSLEKYCSVARILEKTAKITYSYEIEA
jgi:putative redox protein